MADANATTSVDTIVQLGSDNTLFVTAPNQLNPGDSFDGGGGTNTIEVSGAPNAYVFFNNVTLHNYSAINLLGPNAVAAWFDASQFGSGLVSLSLAVTGVDGVGTSLDIFNAGDFDASGFTFTTWQHTADFQTDHRLGINGGGGNDTITGNDATANDLSGGDGNDVLNGAALDDFLYSDAGQDTFNGNGGSDTFYYFSKLDSRKGIANRDVINDFSVGDNLPGGADDDIIDLHEIDAKKGAGNQTFKYIGGHKFHDVKGELQVKYNGTTHIGIVSGDINGDGKADFQIEVHSLLALGKADFVL
jgi:Ca2+-binding RTX toxin-like protein